jgi:hypothetical protein
MKVTILIATTWLILLTAVPTYAGCGDDSNCPNQYCSTCQCTDAGRGRNPCVSPSDYCEAFGNIGAR